MSALDQAFIKAYAKDQPAPPATAPVAVARGAARPRSVAVQSPVAPTIEQLYRDGTLYRIEAPVAAPRAASAVPAPHLSHLPPTSPRRHVRRSILKLLAGNNAAAASVPPPPADPPPRIARKVIIRHISHGSPPQPRGLLTRPAPPQADLPPETIGDPPQTIADEPAPHVPLPIAPSPPQIAPLNEAVVFGPHIAVPEPRQAAALFANVVLTGSPEWKNCSSELVTVQLESLEAAREGAWRIDAEREDVSQNTPTVDRTSPPSAPFTAKALDHSDEPQVIVRVDEPHALASHRSHLRFTPPAEPVETPSPEPAAEVAATAVESATATTDDEPIVAATVTAPESPLEFAAEEFTSAEPAEEPLASDLVPRDESTSLSTAAQLEVPLAARSAIPLWEVDRFHWPKTCEKLLADDSGYLAHAGEKLLAAVEDGLRVLAITGSRRGEGRTTLALCLARTAAAAGIQVAVMDADFARPQVASKIGLEIAFGWQEAAWGKIPLSEAAVKSLADNVTVLPLEPCAEGRSLSLADPRVTATVRAAAATFDLLILDLGPMGPGEEICFPMDEACPLDAAIVVRDSRFATTSESEAIGHSLQEAGVEAVGIAENFVVEEDIPVTSV